MSTSNKLLVVIVLYKHSPNESAAFTSLLDNLSAFPEAQDAIECLLYDNSPHPSLVPEAPFRCTYVHDATNPGLAIPYSQALQQAAQAGLSWLMLLDQDTVVTREYFAEVLATTQEVESDTSITALAPKLTQRGHVLSPHWFMQHPKSVDIQSSGIIENTVQVFNSGAVIRVADLLSIGGFDKTFPLDYLDHATFHELQARGGKVFLLHAVLHHELSQNDPLGFDSPAFVRRYWPSLKAEHQYYVRYASAGEMFWHYGRRFRMLLGLLARFRFRRAIRHIRCTI